MKRKKSLALITALIFLFSLLTMPVSASFSDSQEHWAKEAIDRWSDAGIIVGDDQGNFRPDESMTRAEFAVVLDRLMDYQTRADNTFTDIDSDSWYADAILCANAAGILQGTSASSASPMSNITREQAIVLLGRALKITENASESLQYSDAGEISDYAAGYIGGMSTLGLVQGNEGKISPKSNITRAEVAAILNNAISDVVSTAGAYTKNADGSIIVNKAGAEINNSTIAGNLIISEGVGSGEVTLNNTSVGGKLVIRGGGTNSVIIKGTSSVENVVMERRDGSVRVSVEGSSKVGSVHVSDVSDNVKLEGSIDTVEVGASSTTEITGTVNNISVIESAAGATVNITDTAKVNNVSVAAANTDISVSGKIDSLSIQSTANATSLNVAKNATVEKVNTSAGEVSVKGEGEVKNVVVEGGNNVTVSENTTVGTLENKSTSEISLGDKTVPSGESASQTSTSTSSSESSGGGGGGGGGGGHVHHWDNGTITKAATCTESGVKTYTCSGCKNTRTETIPATGHSYSSCTENGDKTHTKICANCGDIVTEACTFTESSAEVPSADDEIVLITTTTHTCDVCGYSYIKVIDDTYEAMYNNELYKTLEEAVAAASQTGSTVSLVNNVSIESQIDLSSDLVLDGGGYIISAGDADWSAQNDGKHLIGISKANNVTLKNIILENDSKAYGVQPYVSSNVTLTNVTVKDSAGAGLTVNGSDVSASGLNISNSAWGCVNVDIGLGVATSSSFTMTGINTLTAKEGTPEIWSDGKYVTDDITVSVIADGYDKVIAPQTNFPQFTIWMSDPEAISEAKIGDVYYMTLETAFYMSDEDDTIVLIDDATIETPISISKSLIIDGANKTLTCAQAGFFIDDDLESLEIKDLSLIGSNATGQEAMEESYMGLGTYNMGYGIDELIISGCTIEGFDYGIYFSANKDALKTISAAVSDTTFKNNLIKGIYVENWTDSSFDGCTVENNGSDADAVSDNFKNWTSGIDINLKYGDYENISVANTVFTSNGANNGGALMIKARGTGDDTSYENKPATLVSVTVDGCTFSSNNKNIVLGEMGKNNTSPTNETITNCTSDDETLITDYRESATPEL